MSLNLHKRCTWANSNELMMQYHDREWGKPIYDSRLLWEQLMLEGFQAGLSWETVLRKRDAFKIAFDNFDPKKIAEYDNNKIESLLQNKGIIRSKAKIIATITGAQIYNQMEADGDCFSDYCWSFTKGKILRGKPYITESSVSNQISISLKKKGFKFVGPVIVYAWMQAVGITNDHSSNCFCYKSIKESVL